ncbi:Poly(ADP-ribose) glycohydrolase ARH3 [Araneus ventricosus]|uniref:ADP-ribosylhydrolase ARH3 n=1 Tax=Araneus ventricosus TaxID=182803 RepID=A0A4Y2L9G0_ARAVE|nr:Poly(ADP-ribose) glycohydrolase ARH3 [Araneus ventricosus]
MASVESNSGLLSKFRGCMIGSLIGDCLGEPFELRTRASKTVLRNYFSNLLSGGSTKMFPYTDDTSMTLSVARSLVENKKIDPKDLAKRFVDEYFREPNLSYGTHVVVVFYALKETNFEDVFLPGKMQFNGSGSYGNGAAMRIAPIALFDHNKTDESLKRDVEECSRITHNHPYGYNGAILQCLAIKAALKSDSSKEFDPVDFISQLEKKMETIETKDDSPYCESLKKIKEIYLQDHEDISAEEIAKCLGNDETAHESVPAAIYSFLRGMKPLSDFECSNPFVRTIYFAISIGGDTDTIAAMAGSIAGAYYGIDGIPTELQERCEFRDEVDNLTYKLYDVSQEDTS